MVAALVFMVTISPIIGLAQENKGDKMKQFMKNSTPAERADFQTDLMVETLSLSDEQVEQIRAVNLKHAEKAEEIYNSQERKFKKFKKMRKMRNKKDKELKTILSDEQYETYEKNKKEMREKLKHKRQSQS